MAVRRVPDRLQGDFKSDTISDLALPIVAYQIRTSVAALDTAKKQGTLVRGPGAASSH